MVLSIIIPAYNAEPYLDELLERLKPQITDEVEVIVVDDGSTVPIKRDNWYRLIRQKNRGLSASRNKGMAVANGEYISFIDADDLVSENYVSEIFKCMPFDYVEMSWQSFGGHNCGCKLNSEKDRLNNPSVCTRCFKKSFIGDLRFNEKKDSTEDEDFSRKIGYERGVRKNILAIMYWYRTSTNVMSNNYRAGKTKTKRIVYYYKHVYSDMTWLLEDIKKEDERNEVWVLTYACDLAELKKYAQVVEPFSLWTHIYRGERGYKGVVIEHV